MSASRAERAAIARALPAAIDDLLSPEETARLNAGLKRLADQRRRAEVESRCLRMA